MFRQLGRFALLALCLFAIVIAMGSCGPDDPPPPPIEPVEETPGDVDPVDPPVELTPMEKLTGTWVCTKWVEPQFEREITLANEGITIKLYLQPEGIGWVQSVNRPKPDLKFGIFNFTEELLSGLKWTATDTTLTREEILDAFGSIVNDYTLTGGDRYLRLNDSWVSPGVPKRYTLWEKED